MHYPPMHYPPPKPKPLPENVEKTRKAFGWFVYGISMLVGFALFVLLFFIAPLLEGEASLAYYTMAVGAALALPMLIIYVWIPWVVDRYDPEPLWALAAALAWGAIVGCGVSGTINTVVQIVVQGITQSRAIGSAIGSCVSAPVVEEACKGAGIFWFYYFRKRDFDGVVDGIIYATFIALGFAAFENIIYYARAEEASLIDPNTHALTQLFVMRGILAPWGHPLYTAMTGIGFGIARETSNTQLRFMAPILGYFGAVFLHFVWNASATLSGFLVILMLPLWFLFVFAFFCLLVWLVARKGKIIRSYLEDEVVLGHLTPYELGLVSSPFGAWSASLSYGGKHGRKLLSLASRLGLSKWHATRANRGKKHTLSADFIVPLRQEIAGVRLHIAHALKGNLQMPKAWTPGDNASPHYPHHAPPQRHSK